MCSLQFQIFTPGILTQLVVHIIGKEETINITERPPTTAKEYEENEDSSPDDDSNGAMVYGDNNGAYDDSNGDIDYDSNGYTYDFRS